MTRPLKKRYISNMTVTERSIDVSENLIHLFDNIAKSFKWHIVRSKNNRRIGPNEANDESKSEGWRILGAEIEIANEIDTFSEVGYLYDGLKNRLTFEEVKKDRKRENAEKKLELERSRNSENEEVEMVAGRSEEEETQEEIGERDSEFIDVVGTSQDDEMMQVEERTDEEQMRMDRLLATINKNSMLAEYTLLAMRKSPSPLPAPQNFSPFLQNSMMQRPLLSLFPPVVAVIQINPMDLSANSEKVRRRKVRTQAKSINNRPERLLFRPF